MYNQYIMRVKKSVKFHNECEEVEALRRIKNFMALQTYKKDYIINHRIIKKQSNNPITSTPTSLNIFNQSQ